MTTGPEHQAPPATAPSRREALSGLRHEEVAAARARFGENRLPVQAGIGPLAILVNQVRSPLIWIILAAAGISLALGELSDFAIIMLVVVVDVALGFVQEYQAQRAYQGLRGLVHPTATVIRDGVRVTVEVVDLVPGDLVVVGAGDRVPADAQLLEATRLAVDEAILTGESEPVTKAVADGVAAAGVAGMSAERSREETAEDLVRRSQLFMGSTVLTGRAIARVTATGRATELGRIATGLVDRDEEGTPLQVRLRAFSRVLTQVVIAATAVILVTGIVAGREPLAMLRTAIVLAIAAVPEGLIIAVTVILVLGMQRILRRRGLVRRLLAVETLGSVTVICTDKTGTLTEGRMGVQRVLLSDEARAFQVMALCNDLDGPVDVALWEHAEERRPGAAQALVDGARRVTEELFTSETKYMLVEVEALDAAGAPAGPAPGVRHTFLLKGAPEVVLGMCDLARPERETLIATVDLWAGEGLRLLGLATRDGGQPDDHEGYAWCGLVGMADPVREGVPEAVALAIRAGIRVVMLTGDYRRTAESIAAEVGIAERGKAGRILEGREVGALSDEQLRERVHDTTIYARVRPQDKLRIVRALEANGEVTAMIGDGVNDAPALTHAHIGVVVGTATDVARETADLVLLDNSFGTIVAAVEEGRVIFDNIRKVVAYVLSNSFAEVITIFVAMLLGWPAPLLVAQILWIHLICDGPEDLVLGWEPREPGIMDRRPASLREPILDRLAAGLIAGISLTSATVALAIFGWHHLVAGDPEVGRSLVFACFASGSVIYILAYRSLRIPIWRMSSPTANRPLLWTVALGLLMTVLPFVVPPLRDALELVPLAAGEWLIVASFAAGLLAIVEVAKAVANRSQRWPPRGG